MADCDYAYACVQRAGEINLRGSTFKRMRIVSKFGGKIRGFTVTDCINISGTADGIVHGHTKKNTEVKCDKSGVKVRLEREGEPQTSNGNNVATSSSIHGNNVTTSSQVSLTVNGSDIAIDKDSNTIMSQCKSKLIRQDGSWTIEPYTEGHKSWDIPSNIRFNEIKAINGGQVLVDPRLLTSSVSFSAESDGPESNITTLMARCDYAYVHVHGAANINFIGSLFNRMHINVEWGGKVRGFTVIDYLNIFGTMDGLIIGHLKPNTEVKQDPHGVEVHLQREGESQSSDSFFAPLNPDNMVSRGYWPMYANHPENQFPEGSEMKQLFG